MVVSGSGHAIDGTVALALDSDAWITAGGGDSLVIAGDISNGTAAHGIIKDGLGTLVLSGSDTYTGGTTVDAGTVVIAGNMALPDGTSLTIGAGGTLIFGPPASAPPAFLARGSIGAIAALPEPGSLARSQRRRLRRGRLSMPWAATERQ